MFKALAQRFGQLSRHGFNDISLVTQDYCHSKTTMTAVLFSSAARTTIRSLQPHGASSNGIVLHGCLGRFAGVWHIHHAANVVPGVIVSRTGRREAGQLPHVAWSAILTSPTDMDHTATYPLQPHRSLSPEESRFRYQSTA